MEVKVVRGKTMKLELRSLYLSKSSARHLCVDVLISLASEHYFSPCYRDHHHAFLALLQLPAAKACSLLHISFAVTPALTNRTIGSCHCNSESAQQT